MGVWFGDCKLKGVRGVSFKIWELGIIKVKFSEIGLFLILLCLVFVGVDFKGEGG